MDKEIKELLKEILANQVIIYKRLEDVEYKAKGSGFQSAPLKTYAEELNKQASEIIKNWE